MSHTQILPCPSCGAKNRVPMEKVEHGEIPICGRCKTRIMVSLGPIVVTDASFLTEVERSPIPVLVDMWAPWCGPCRQIAPMIEELAHEMAGRIKFAKMNTDENPATASRFEIRSIPTLLVFRDGKEVERIVGLQPKGAIVQRLERVAR